MDIGTKVWGPGPVPYARVLLAVPGDVVTAEQLLEWQDDDGVVFEVEPEPVEPEPVEPEPAKDASAPSPSRPRRKSSR